MDHEKQGSHLTTVTSIEGARERRRRQTLETLYNLKYQFDSDSSLLAEQVTLGQISVNDMAVTLQRSLVGWRELILSTAGISERAFAEYIRERQSIESGMIRDDGRTDR